MYGWYVYLHLVDVYLVNDGKCQSIYHTWMIWWWFQICWIFTPNLGEMIQFDLYIYIFQMGWFNHHQVKDMVMLLRYWFGGFPATNFHHIYQAPNPQRPTRWWDTKIWRTPVEQWKKGPWLFRVYRELYYPGMWGLFENHYNIIRRIPIKQPARGFYSWLSSSWLTNDLIGLPIFFFHVRFGGLLGSQWAKGPGPQFLMAEEMGLYYRLVWCCHMFSFNSDYLV